MQVADIFMEEDEDTDHSKNSRKKLRAGAPPPSADTAANKKHDNIKKEKEKESSGADDKRKHIKSLIEKIPTDKTALFAYSIDWDLVDNSLMEKRIRPWVNKKIAEYIGEPEPTLTDFICSKVLAGSAPKAILEDVQMVLDEEAEVFVVKMWRLLIYEIENKKQKASTTATSAAAVGTK
jgi:RNA-binding protein 25